MCEVFIVTYHFFVIHHCMYDVHSLLHLLSKYLSHYMV